LQKSVEDKAEIIFKNFQGGCLQSTDKINTSLDLMDRAVTTLLDKHEEEN
jgi:hypothetical protein